jgi:hypothetical protein
LQVLQIAICVAPSHHHDELINASATKRLNPPYRRKLHNKFHGEPQEIPDRSPARQLAIGPISV